MKKKLNDGVLLKEGVSLDADDGLLLKEGVSLGGVDDGQISSSFKGVRLVIIRQCY
jgi:hypothetical protein